MGWLNIKGICFRQQRVDNIEKCSAVVFWGKEGGQKVTYGKILKILMGYSRWKSEKKKM